MISKLVRRFAFLLAVPLLFFYPGEYGQTRPAQSKFVKNIILVHGAWADGSSWSKIIPLLEGDGLHVDAVQLPMTSLSDDVATVNRALALEDGPVLLVGHSGFTSSALDGYALRGHLPARSARMPQIRFLFIGSYVCSTLLSDPPSPERPCASLLLHLHQVVEGTFTPELSNMLGTQTKEAARSRP